MNQGKKLYHFLEILNEALSESKTINKCWSDYLLSFQLLPLPDELQQQTGSLQVMTKPVPLFELLLQDLVCLHIVLQETHKAGLSKNQVKAQTTVVSSTDCLLGFWRLRVGL